MPFGFNNNNKNSSNSNNNSSNGMDSNKAARVAELEQSEALLRCQLLNIEDQLIKTKEDLNFSKKQNDELADQCGKLEGCLERLKAERSLLSDLKNENGNLRQKLNQSETESFQIAEKLAQITQKNADLEHQNSQLNHQNGYKLADGRNLQEILDENARLKQDNYSVGESALNEEKLALEEKAEELKLERNLHSSMQGNLIEQIEALQDEVSKLKNEVKAEKLRSDAVDLLRESLAVVQKEKNELQNKCMKQKDEIEQLQQQIETVQDSLEQNNLQLMQETNKLAVEYRSSLEENSKLKLQLQTSQLHGRINEILRNQLNILLQSHINKQTTIDQQQHNSLNDDQFTQLLDRLLHDDDVSGRHLVSGIDLQQVRDLVDGNHRIVSSVTHACEKSEFYRDAASKSSARSDQLGKELEDFNRDIFWRQLEDIQSEYSKQEENLLKFTNNFVDRIFHQITSEQQKRGSPRSDDDGTRQQREIRTRLASLTSSSTPRPGHDDDDDDDATMTSHTLQHVRHSARVVASVYDVIRDTCELLVTSPRHESYGAPPHGGAVHLLVEKHSSSSSSSSSSGSSSTATTSFRPSSVTESSIAHHQQARVTTDNGYDVTRDAYVIPEHEEDHMVALLRAENARLLRLLDDDTDNVMTSHHHHHEQVRHRRVRRRLLRVECFLIKFAHMRAVIRLACGDLI